MADHIGNSYSVPSNASFQVLLVGSFFSITHRAPRYDKGISAKRLEVGKMVLVPASIVDGQRETKRMIRSIP